MTERLQVAHPDEKILLIKLSGEWTLADGIPSPEEILTGIGVKPGVRSLAFDTAEIGRWDNGLLIFLSFLKLLRGKAHLRRQDLWAQMRMCGADALPIVTLILFLIGMILGFTAAIPLRMFGAEIYISSLVGIAVVREMAGNLSQLIPTDKVHI